MNNLTADNLTSTEPVFWEAVLCPAVGQINDLGKGAFDWLPFSFFVAPDKQARIDLEEAVMSRR